MVVEHTKAWLKEVVIGLGLCPFAYEVYSKDQITYAVLPFSTAETFLESFKANVSAILANNSTSSTALIIIPEGLEQFEDFLAVYYTMEDYLKNDKIDEAIQLASFHPQYQFSGTEYDDPENYTNRSPFPIIHLLRVDKVEEAISSHPDIASVPLGNINTMKKMGNKGMEDLLKKIYSK